MIQFEAIFKVLDTLYICLVKISDGGQALAGCYACFPYIEKIGVKNMRSKRIFISLICIVLSVTLFFSLFNLLSIHKSLSINNYVVYHSRADIPTQYKWNMSDIYATDKDIESDLNAAEEQLTICINMLRTVEPENICEVLDTYYFIEMIATKLNNFLQLHKLVGEEDAIIQKRNIEILYQKTTSIYRFISSIIISFSDDDIKILSENNPKYNKMIAYIRNHKEEFRGNSYLEGVISQVENNYYELTDNIEFPNFRYSDGTKIELNYSSFISSMQNKSRNLREDVYNKYYKSYQSSYTELADNLINYTYFCDIYSQTKGFNSTLEYCLWKTDVNQSVYHSSLRAVQDNIDLLNEYNLIKMDLLQIDSLEMYDVYVSPYKGSNKYIPYEDAKNIILEALRPLGDEYISIVKMMFEERWIDVYSTRDKEQDSLQVDFYNVHPYILINYQGNESDIYTLIHEIGHAVQSYFLSHRYEYWEFGVPEFLVEIPSSLNEVLLSEYFMRNSLSNEEKIQRSFDYIEKMRINVFRQAQISEFEYELYNNDLLNNQNINDIYYKINQKYYKATDESDHLISYEWCRLSSLYSNFYDYQYITSFGAAMQIYDSALYKLGCLVVGKYDAPLTVMQQYGIDFESINMYAPVFDKMKKLISIIKE